MIQEQPQLETFLNTELEVIGRTVSTKYEPNTSSKFHFWVASKENVQGILEIGNIVAAFSDDESDITFGQVTEMRSYSDIDNFINDYLSHNFGEAQIEIPTDISEVVVVTCSVMRNVSRKTKPVGRSRVYFPTALGIEYAYGIVDEFGETIFSGAPIPIGIFENGDGTKAKISLDEDFLVGPESAHLNVSGISGLASKTSSILFIIKSLLNHTSKNVATVMFNVKSKDLLYIDQLNPRLEQEEWSQDAYSVLDIEQTPFSQARFFAPADPSRPNHTQSLRELKTERFEWDLSMIYHDIPSLFSSNDWDERMEGVWYIIRQRIEEGNLLTYSQMLNWVDRIISRAGQSQYVYGNHIATWNKMRSHLQRFPNSYRGLIATAGQGRDIPWNELTKGSVFVIDMQMLNDQGQRLVFGRSVHTLSRLLEFGNTDLNSIVIFVDELNKFAPSGSIRTPLKSRLIEITARGRSLGLVLFGAEQFASAVDKEIVENCSTYLFGRTEANELRTPNYSSFTDEIKTKLTMLPQGNLLVKFAKFPQPIFVKFPFPPSMPGNQFNFKEWKQNQNKV